MSLPTPSIFNGNIWTGSLSLHYGVFWGTAGYPGKPKSVLRDQSVRGPPCSSLGRPSSPQYWLLTSTHDDWRAGLRTEVRGCIRLWMKIRTCIFVIFNYLQQSPIIIVYWLLTLCYTTVLGYYNCCNYVNSALHPPWVAKSSTSFDWG